MPKTDTRETMVNVKEATGEAASPPSSEFVRQGMSAIQAVNRGLARMQTELSYLVNSQAQAAQRGIIVVGGSPQGGPYATPGQAAFASQAASPQAYASPWSANAFAPSSSAATSPWSANAFAPSSSAAPSPWPANAFPAGTIPSASPMSLYPGFGVAPAPTPSPWGTPPPSFPQGAPSMGAGASAFGNSPAIVGFSPYQETPGRNVSLNPQPLPPQGTLLGGPDTTPFARQEAGLSPVFRSSHDLQNSAPVGRIPACDLIDEGSEFLIRVEVPGCTAEKLDLTCYPTGIVVSARADNAIPDGTVLLSESGRVAFRRAIELPAEIKTHEVKASLRDGILSVHLAKQVPTEGPRHIDVAYR